MENKNHQSPALGVWIILGGGVPQEVLLGWEWGVWGLGWGLWGSPMGLWGGLLGLWGILGLWQGTYGVWGEPWG